MAAIAARTSAGVSESRSEATAASVSSSSCMSSLSIAERLSIRATSAFSPVLRHAAPLRLRRGTAQRARYSVGLPRGHAFAPELKRKIAKAAEIGWIYRRFLAAFAILAVNVPIRIPRGPRYAYASTDRKAARSSSVEQGFVCVASADRRTAVSRPVFHERLAAASAIRFALRSIMNCMTYGKPTLDAVELRRQLRLEAEHDHAARST